MWIPGLTRVNLGLHGGPYDDTRTPKALWHTTEGGSVAGARRAFANYPPHLCYDPRDRKGEQYVPLDRCSYSLKGSESDDEFCIQIELVGYAAQTHTWPDDWLRNIGRDLIRPLRELAGVPDAVVWHGFRQANQGIVLASSTSPIRLTATQLRGFSGHLGHQHAPAPDDHWDPGGLDITRAIALSYELPTPEVDTTMRMHMARTSSDPTVWLGNGMQRRIIQDPTELGNIQWWLAHRYGQADVNVEITDDLRVLGEPIDGQAVGFAEDVAALLIPAAVAAIERSTGDLTTAQLEAIARAVNDEQAKRLNT